jgi:hypothetical protein
MQKSVRHITDFSRGMVGPYLSAQVEQDVQPVGLDEIVNLIPQPNGTLQTMPPISLSKHNVTSVDVWDNESDAIRLFSFPVYELVNPGNRSQRVGDIVFFFRQAPGTSSTGFPCAVYYTVYGNDLRVLASGSINLPDLFIDTNLSGTWTSGELYQSRRSNFVACQGGLNNVLVTSGADVFSLYYSTSGIFSVQNVGEGLFIPTPVGDPGVWDEFGFSIAPTATSGVSMLWMGVLQNRLVFLYRRPGDTIGLLASASGTLFDFATISAPIAASDYIVQSFDIKGIVNNVVENDRAIFLCTDDGVWALDKLSPLDGSSITPASLTQVSQQVPECGFASSRSYLFALDKGYLTQTRPSTEHLGFVTEDLVPVVWRNETYRGPTMAIDGTPAGGAGTNTYFRPQIFTCIAGDFYCIVERDKINCVAVHGPPRSFYIIPVAKWDANTTVRLRSKQSMWGIPTGNETTIFFGLTIMNEGLAYYHIAAVKLTSHSVPSFYYADGSRISTDAPRIIGRIIPANTFNLSNSTVLNKQSWEDDLYGEQITSDFEGFNRRFPSDSTSNELDSYSLSRRHNWYWTLSSDAWFLTQRNFSAGYGNTMRKVSADIYLWESNSIKLSTVGQPKMIEVSPAKGPVVLSSSNTKEQFAATDVLSVDLPCDIRREGVQIVGLIEHAYPMTILGLQFTEVFH